MGRVLTPSETPLRLQRSARIALWMAGTIVFGATVSLAAEKIQQTFNTTADPTFLLHIHNGKISIEGWDQSAIQIHGDGATDLLEVIINGGDKDVSVMTHPKKGVPGAEKARLDFEVRLPRQAAVRVESERGDIVVKNVEGSLDIEAVSNPITLSHLKGRITVRTVDGPIVIQSADGTVDADSISGNLRLVQVNGPEVRANTNSGTIRYEGDFGGGGTYTLNNYSSPIDIFASARASFDLTARAVVGLIESTLAFRPTPVGNAFRQLSPDKFLQGRFNSGQSTVRVTSYSGTIRVRGPLSAQPSP
jgi:putative adhesin